MDREIFNIETLGEAMRPESLRGEVFRLSREERDYIAGHALNSVYERAKNLTVCGVTGWEDPYVGTASSAARQIAALSNLLGDIGWEQEATGPMRPELGQYWPIGELFPVVQLRPWLEEWQHQDDEALVEQETNLEIALAAEDDGEFEVKVRQAITRAQTKLGTGAILLARIEKWMASHGN
jgi:hypothetical protein